MKTIAKYVADDGKEFTSEIKCIAHETACKVATEIMGELHARPDDCAFSNGSGFIKHDTGAVRDVKVAFLKFVKLAYEIDHKWIQQTIDDPDGVDSSWVDRIVGEYAATTIYKHWSRFCCIDDSGREWGQPFYVKNPHEAKQVCLNGVTT